MSEPTPTPTKPATPKFAPDFLTEMFRNPLDAGYAEAAKRRTEQGPDTPRRRRLGVTARTVILILTGVLLTVAYHQTVAAKPESTKVRDGLISDVKHSRANADALQKQADALRDQVSRERDQSLAGAGIDRDQLAALELASGLSKVTGDGAVVRLGDAPTPIDPVTGQQDTVNNGTVFDSDLQNVTNELWRQGAEAIAINGERLTTTSTIRKAGNAILVDFRPVTSPYEVLAIGPKDLDKRFTRSSTGQDFLGLADKYGMQVSIKSRKNMTLPAGPDPQLFYAHPVPSGSPSPAPSQSGSPTSSPPSVKPSSPKPHSSSPSGGH